MPDRVVRIPGSDTTWYVDGSNVRHHIPNGGTFLCLTVWKGKQVVELSQDQVNLLSQGDDASCRVDEQEPPTPSSGAPTPVSRGSSTAT